MFFKNSIKTSTQTIKNSYELDKIPEERRFVSESGYVYDLNEIVDYFKGQGKAFDKESYKDVIPGLLKDFKNRGSASLNNNVFTEKDMVQLMKYPPLKEAIEEAKNYETLTDFALAIKPDTLKMIKEVADASVEMENPHVATDEDAMGQLMGGPVHDLWKHLTKAIAEFPLDEQGDRKGERYALKKLTDWSLYTTYIMMRGKTLDEDLTTIVTTKSCSAGFNRQMSNLSVLIATYNNYQNAIAYKDEGPQNA